MDFYFHAPYAIIKYLIKAVLVTAPAHVAPGLLKWFIKAKNTQLSDIPQIPADWNKMMSIASETAAKLNALCK